MSTTCFLADAGSLIGGVLMIALAISFVVAIWNWLTSSGSSRTGEWIVIRGSSRSGTDWGEVIGGIIMVIIVGSIIVFVLPYVLGLIAIVLVIVAIASLISWLSS